jgi:hypothetical protein
MIYKTRRRIEALSLRELGYSYDQIGTELGVKPIVAKHLVNDAFEALAAEEEEKAAVVRSLEVIRLDAMFKNLYPHAKQGNLKAIDMTLKIMQRRAALLGIDLEAQKTEFKTEKNYVVNVAARIEEYTAQLDRELAAGHKALPGPAEGNGRGEPVDQASPDVQAEPLPLL